LGYLAFIAISIASLGLLGLVIYTIEARRKEISIRKIVGAGNKQLVRLLSKAYIKLLFIAGFIAMPLGYVASQFFLQNFADRIRFGPIAVVPAFAILLAIGLTVVISQTYKAAADNPVRSLRAE
jgi:putative ABC transport system permease protein